MEQEGNVLQEPAAAHCQKLSYPHSISSQIGLNICWHKKLRGETPSSSSSELLLLAAISAAISVLIL